MKNKTHQPSQAPIASATHPIRPPRLLRLTVLPLLLAGSLLAVATLHAQTPAPAPDRSSVLSPQSSVPVDPGPLQPVIDGLVGKYGWLTTVLLAIGSLRILFKPVMLVVENSVKNDPVKLAEVQRFEAGPIYKAIATVLDVGASIKLPLVKPPGPPAP